MIKIILYVLYLYCTCTVVVRRSILSQKLILILLICCVYKAHSQPSIMTGFIVRLLNDHKQRSYSSKNRAEQVSVLATFLTEPPEISQPLPTSQVRSPQGQTNRQGGGLPLCFSDKHFRKGTFSCWIMGAEGLRNMKECCMCIFSPNLTSLAEEG